MFRNKCWDAGVGQMCGRWTLARMEAKWRSGDARSLSSPGIRSPTACRRIVGKPWEPSSLDIGPVMPGRCRCSRKARIATGEGRGSIVSRDC